MNIVNLITMQVLIMLHVYQFHATWYLLQLHDIYHIYTICIYKNISKDLPSDRV